MMSWLAVGIGAALGAWLRWHLAIWLNLSHNYLAMGTVAANLGGGYLIGIATAFFQTYPNLPPEWRLLAVTGFLGGLTTFSTFSGESMVLMQKGEYLWALAHSALHLVGSIGCCMAGYATYKAIAG
jgi:CrcB protein